MHPRVRVDRGAVLCCVTGCFAFGGKSYEYIRHLLVSYYILRPPRLDALPHPVARAATLILARVEMQQDLLFLFHQRGR